MRVIGIANAKGGVGKSFLASNLAHVVSTHGKSVVLVDLDPHVPTLDLVFPDAKLGGLWGPNEANPALHEVNSKLSVLVAGPSALSTVEADCRSSLDWRGLNPEADIVLVDLGPGLTPLHRSVLGSADQVLMVLTPEPAGILGALRTSRAVLMENPTADIVAVVNRSTSKASADKVARQFSECMGRFLSHEISYWGFVPADPRAEQCGAKGAVFSVAHGKSGTAKRIAAVSRRLLTFQGFVDEFTLVSSFRPTPDSSVQKAA